MGDLIVVLVIALCLAAVLWYHVSRRKKGETGCGCGCSGCNMPSGASDCGCGRQTNLRQEKHSE